MKVLGGIEAGGTKFVCGIGTGPGDLTTTQFPTTSPDETIGKAIDWFREQGGARLEAVGIASFGPVDLDPDSATFGSITSTPKAGWQNTDIAGAIRERLSVPVGFDTDVDAAALGEAKWGAAQGLSDFMYLTVGTGIGGGAIINGHVLHGMLHPEMGHIRIPHDTARDSYPGCCPFHGDCLEGLASGPAMEARWKTKASNLAPDHPAWELEAHYLALAITSWVCTLSPRCILLGGGVMQQAHLFELIRGELARLLNGYIRTEQVLSGLERYVRAPLLGPRAGVLGALVLAEHARASEAVQSQVLSGRTR